MILSFYDPIEYTAKTVNAKSQSVLLTNIFKNYTKYFKKVAKNYNMITYYIQGAPSPEYLSYEIYNNSQFYWAILMANDVYDPYHGWIKTQEACYQSIAQEYPDPENMIAYHIDARGERYYNLISYPENPTQWFDRGDKNKQYPQYNGALAAVSIYEAAILKNEEKRKIKIIAPQDMDNFLSELIKEMERNEK